MERVFLCLLCFSGWSVSSCQYHFVNDPMTWTEAQTYCREKHSDMATVKSTEELDQLMSSVPSELSSSYLWIGLYSKIQWKWSDSYNASESNYTNWENTVDNEPDFYSGDQHCGQLDDKGRWWDETCSTSWTFLCYSGTQQDPDFVFVSEAKTWFDAQRYCRENYVDLATLRNNTENQKIQSLLQPGYFTWIGLYRDPEIWSDGSRSSFQFWSYGAHPLGSMSEICGLAAMWNSGSWSPESCEEKYPFVCQDRGSKHVIKLRMKPDDPSVDLNDPAVKEGLLRELQEQLEKNGLSGVTLKWREQPDGKVFHKEEESSQREMCEFNPVI